MKHNAKFALLTGLFTGLFMLIVFVAAHYAGVTLFSDQTFSGYVATGILAGLCVLLAQLVAKKFKY
jgi:hypothetical protein